MLRSDRLAGPTSSVVIPRGDEGARKVGWSE
jgi:hypothetical protein